MKKKSESEKETTEERQTENGSSDPSTGSVNTNQMGPGGFQGSMLVNDPEELLNSDANFKTLIQNLTKAGVETPHIVRFRPTELTGLSSLNFDISVSFNEDDVDINGTGPGGTPGNLLVLGEENDTQNLINNTLKVLKDISQNNPETVNVNRSLFDKLSSLHTVRGVKIDIR